MFNMKRKTCFYKWLVAVFVLICNTITMSAQTKVTSANQLKAGCVIKIYPKERYQDHYDDKDYALACSGDGQPLDTYKNVVSGDEWTLEDAGDGSCYIKNNNGCYWAYQGSSLDEGMKCTANKSSAVKVKLTWDSKNGGVCFWNDIDGSGLIGYGDSFYWWTYPDEDDPYFHVTFDIALLKEGSGSDIVQDEKTNVIVGGIKYNLDVNQKTAKVIANNHSYSGDIDIPANITSGINSLGYSCFSGCKGLASVYVYAEQLPTMGYTVFENCDADNCILYVPKGTIDMYRQSDFGYFKNIVELDATGINNPAVSTNLKEVYRYTTNGRRILTPTKGINVVKYSNGMVKKELVK